MHSVTAPSGFKASFKSCPENSSGWLARWLSVSATTLPQVAKMGKSSRRVLRYRQGYRVGSWKRFFPCDYTEARGPLSPLVYRMGTRTCRLQEQMRGTYLAHRWSQVLLFWFTLLGNTFNHKYCFHLTPLDSDDIF